MLELIFLKIFSACIEMIGIWFLFYLNTILRHVELKMYHQVLTIHLVTQFYFKRGSRTHLSRVVNIFEAYFLLWVWRSILSTHSDCVIFLLEMIALKQKNAILLENCIQSLLYVGFLKRSLRAHTRVDYSVSFYVCLIYFLKLGHI